MVVITISGKARAGKDSLANMMRNYFESKGKKVSIVHYADELKWIARTLYHWDGEKDEYGRSLLQKIGDIGRAYDENYWVFNLVNRVTAFLNITDYVIIPDCRYPNEINVWKERESIVSILVQRPDFLNDLTEEQRHHSSETALDNYSFDYTAECTNLAELEQVAEKICKSLENEV